MPRWSFMLLLGLCAFNAFGQGPDMSAMNSLIVHGDGFSFSVKEPFGWQGDTEHAAEQHANILFHCAGESTEGCPGLIQVALFKKQDEKTDEDLAYDVRTYEQQYPGLKKEDFVAVHAEYRVVAKLVLVEKDFYQYIAYVNPGAKYDAGFSVAMNIPKRRADEWELKGFREIIASLWMMGLK